MTKFKNSYKSSILSRTLTDTQYEKRNDDLYANNIPTSQQSPQPHFWTSRPQFHGYKVPNVASITDDNSSLSPSGMDLTTSVANEYREDRASIDRRPKISSDYGINSVHNHNETTANCNYHVYLNEVSSKDMIIRNPVQIPSSVPPATSPTSPVLSYPQRPIWNAMGQGALPPQLSTSPMHAETAANSAMFVDSPPSTLVLPTLKKRKRTPQPIPEECKDGAYWERRKRNNESAKRSREMRRVKEQQTNMRVIFLEQDNVRLKTEVTMLRNEVEKLRELLYNRKDDNNKMSA